MTPDIQNIQRKIQEWFKTETGKKYKNSSTQELLFALEQNNVLTPAEINSLRTHSLFSFGKKVEMSEALPLEGWSIEREAQKPQMKQDNSETSKALEQRLNKVKADLDAKVKENRFLRSLWHGVKNAVGFGANSKKVEKALEIERKKISQINNPEVFKELTGTEYTKDNYEKFIRGEIKLKSEQALEAYKQGQDGVVDFAADMVSGVAAVFIYSAAVAAAPFTGGLSVAAGFGAAVVAGAAIKTGLKAGANALSGKEYTKKDFKHDAITGGVSGALGPFTGGVGGAVGKSCAINLLKIQVVKEGVKDIAVSGAKTGLKKWLMTTFTNPAGYKYVGGNLAKRITAFSTEAMTDGALGGALDGGFRAGLENDWDGGAILSGTVEGGIGGAIMAPAIGGGMKLTGKAGHGLGARIKKFFGWGKKSNNALRETATDAVMESTAKKAETVSTETPHKMQEIPETDIRYATSDASELPVTIKDYEDILSLAGENYQRDKDLLLENVKSQKDVAIIKELLEFQFGNGEHIDGFWIRELLPKLKNLEDAQNFLKNCDSNWRIYQVQVEHYNTPYYELCNKFHVSQGDNNDLFKALTKILDSSEKIKQAEIECDNLSGKFLSTSKKIQQVYGKIANVDIENNRNCIKNIITDALGADAYEKHFAGQIDITEMTLENPAQVKAIKEFLKYYDTPFFKNEEYNYQYISNFLNDAIPMIKTEEDLTIMKGLINSKISESQTSEYGKDYMNCSLHFENYFSNSDLAIKCRQFLVKYINLEECSSQNILDFLDSINKINSEDMLSALDNYYAEGFEIRGLDCLINVLDNEFAIEALNNFQKSYKGLLWDDFQWRCYRLKGVEGILGKIKDKVSLDYFTKLLDRRDLYYTEIGRFIKYGIDNNKRNAILMLLDTQFTNAYVRYDIHEIAEIIETDTDLEKLRILINKKKMDSSEKFLDKDMVMNEILGDKFAHYYKILKQQYPSESYLHKLAKEIDNDADLEYATVLLQNSINTSYFSLTKNNPEAKSLLLSMIGNQDSPIHSLNPYIIETYLQEPNGIKKLRDLSLLSPEQYTDDLNKRNTPSMFYTDNYIKDLQNYGKRNGLRHLEDSVPIKSLLTQTETGEVFCHGGKLYINDGDAVVPLNMSEKTYNRLFPQGKQFNTEQGAIGDCWLVATIDVLMQSPKGRAKILSLYQEMPNGDIVINLPNAAPESFPGGKPYSKDDSMFGKHVDACDGLRLLEEACAFEEKKRRNANTDLSIYADMDKTMDFLVGGNDERGLRILLGETGEIPSIKNKDMFEDILNNFANRPNFVIRTGINNGVKIPAIIEIKYDLCSNHAYNVNGYDAKNKIVYLVDPHHTKYRIEIPLEEFKKYFSSMKYLELK